MTLVQLFALFAKQKAGDNFSMLATNSFIAVNIDNLVY